MCDVTRPFGTPVLLAGVTGTAGFDENARLLPDELTVFFASNRSGSNQIFTATRASRTATFGAPQALPAFDNFSNVAFPSPTADLLSMFVESDASGAFQVMVATRATTQVPFSAPSAVATINGGPVNGQPFVLPDRSAIYFISNSAGNTSFDVYHAARGPDGQFQAPVQVTTINTPAREYAPVPTPDELVLYFASERPDPPAQGSFDIWVTKRASTSLPFEPPINVRELNTSFLEWPDWISADRCRLYFDRGDRNIYVAERSPI
jgi:Tol biopolymer transport system component